MILEKIAADTKLRVEKAKRKVPYSEICRRAMAMDANTGFPFEKALAEPGIHYICEVKKASPSKGVIAQDFPYLEIAREYEKAGAAAISCLTEPKYFQGKDAYLKEITENVYAEENHSCGCGSHEGTESGEGCGCGCGERSKIEGANVGKTLKVHYTGTFNDGTKFDSSYDRGEPLEFVCGAGMMIKGFDRAVADMEIGQIKDIHLMPEEAYGLPDPNAIFHVEISQLPGAEELEEGQQVYLQNEMGQPFPVTVVAKEAGIITFDANHEMAGKELNFKIELVEIC